MPLKQIIDEGPHYRYQADIWYLDEDLKYNNNYEYCLDIIDHFSKWLSCYLLTDKTMVNVVSKIKMYILNFGKCKIFQTDNGAEFKNAELKTFLDNEGIKLIFSKLVILDLINSNKNSKFSIKYCRNSCNRNDSGKSILLSISFLSEFC